MGRYAVMTYKIAMAISFDAADRRRREAGRASWNPKDFARAAKTFQKCVVMMKPYEQARYQTTAQTRR